MTTAETFSKFTLESIFLNEAEIRRGDGDPSCPGEMTNAGRFDIANLDDERAAFVVGVASDMLDESGDSILSVDVSFALTYLLREGFRPTAEELQLFVTQGVVFQVHPYLREFIASVTTRAGLPPALLPVLVREDVLPD